LKEKREIGARFPAFADFWFWEAAHLKNFLLP
jgi:hypothetical protein